MKSLDSIDLKLYFYLSIIITRVNIIKSLLSWILHLVPHWGESPTDSFSCRGHRGTYSLGRGLTLTATSEYGHNDKGYDGNHDQYSEHNPKDRSPTQPCSRAWSCHTSSVLWSKWCYNCKTAKKYVIWFGEKINEWMVLLAMTLHCKAILGQGHLGLMRWNLVWMMPQVQDWSLDLLTCSPVRCHCTTAAPLFWWGHYYVLYESAGLDVQIQ